MKETTAQAMMASGIAPMELTENAVISSADRQKQGIFTELCINNLELGALYPAQYRVVTNRNNQSVRLATWAFRRVVTRLSELSENADPCWISVYMPAKMLMRDQLKTLLESESQKSNCDFSRLLVELSSEILYEDAEQAADKMKALRAAYGLRFLLSEFGDEYCPVLRLPLYPVDFVLLDSSLNHAEVLKTSSSAASVKLAKQCGIKVISRLTQPVSGLASDAAPDFYLSLPAKDERRGM